jgi:hypothetical protein
MLTVGLVVGAVLAGPLGFAFGRFAARDRRVEHVQYVAPSLRRSL